MAFTRKNIIEMICYNLNTNNYVLLDDFETDVARHICQRGKIIYLLNKETMNLVLPDGSGSIQVDYFLCRNCGKLYLNKDNLTQVQPMYDPMNQMNQMNQMNGYGAYQNRGFFTGVGEGSRGIW